jgi:hypothetical protein
MHGADRGGLNVAVLASQLLADLRCSPAGMFTPQLHNPLLDLQRQPVGMPVRATTAVSETLQSAILIALVDLVAGLARDIEFPAQHGHFLAVE